MSSDIHCFTGEDNSGASDWNHFFTKGALMSRGWAFQERTLSLRTLYFGSTLSWECDRFFIHESGVIDRHETGFKTSIHPEKERYLSSPGFNQRAALGPTKTITGGCLSSISGQATSRPHTNTITHSDIDPWVGWSRIVMEFTKRKLTVETDRLAAITGLITDFARQTGWTSICGLWKEHLIKELL